jgi:hypothetical protein
VFLERVDAVLCVLYLIFNEGYMAMSGSELIRRELCDESIRLARLLTTLLNQESLYSEVPEALVLLALVLLHDSRREARVGPGGELLFRFQTAEFRMRARVVNGNQEQLGGESASGDEREKVKMTTKWKKITRILPIRELSPDKDPKIHPWGG